MEHPGIYKAVPVAWGLGKEKDSSQSIPVVVEFKATHRLEDGEWVDVLTGYIEQTISGFFYVVGREGNVNAGIVANLAKCLGWNGDPVALLTPPPDVIVQITVDQEEYQGKTSLKVKWLNPGDHVPGIPTQAPEGVDAFRKRFGSQMRAAAADGLKGRPAPTMAQPATTGAEGPLPF